MTRVRRCPAGFTLVELLVVIAIITILAALLVPALNRSRLAARVADTQGELHSLQAAIEVFQNEFGFLPPVTTLDSNKTLITVEVNTQFLDRDYRAGVTGVLRGGSETWAAVRQVVGPGNPPSHWIWENTDTDDFCTYTDLLQPSASAVDLPELLYLMVGTRFRRVDDWGTPVGVLRVTDTFLNRAGQVEQRQRTYYAASASSGPYAELSGSRIGDLDGDTWPEVLDSFANPIIFSVGLRTSGAAELCSLGPDGKLDLVDLNNNGQWDTGELADNGVDDDNDGLVDEKQDQINHVPELVDDIVTW
jgi:prepilin-type N-terminal cleavage/methylation domain-containing protein